MSQIKRQDPFLNEALEVLDLHFENAGGDAFKASMSLGQAERDFVNEEIERIHDFRYYVGNYHVIATESEGFKCLDPFWDSQEIFYEAIWDLQQQGLPAKVLVLKARQLGLSTVAEALVFHKTIITEGCNCLIVAQDPDQADYLFGMSRTAYDSLPWWMRPEVRYDVEGRHMVFDRKDPIQRMTNPGLRSRILVQAANKLTGVAVGKTVRAAHLSELSDWRNAKTLTEHIFPSMNAPDTLAILESTARGRGDFWHRFWVDAVEGKLSGMWKPVFIEFFRVKKYFIPVPSDEEFVLSKEEKSMREKVKTEKGVEISDGQFNWRRITMQLFQTLQGDVSKFYQEYPSSSWMEAFQGSGRCAFNKRRLQTALETTCCDPLYYGEIELQEVKGGGMRPLVKLRASFKDKQAGQSIPTAKYYGARLYVWEPPQEGADYYIGADVAHGIEGGNYSCAQVIKIGRKMDKDEQVAEWHGWINPTPFGNALAGLGYWYNTAQIAVESNEVGLTTLNHLLRVLEYQNLFRWKHYDKLKNFMTDFMGWLTTNKTRPAIITKMREAIDEDTLVIRSQWLVDECLDFSSVESAGVRERFEGQTGDDDRVLAMMITNFCAHDSDWGIRASMRDPDEETKIDKSRDYYNTDFSPVHDISSERNRLHNRDKVPAEVLMYGDTGSVGESREDLWKLL